MRQLAVGEAELRREIEGTPAVRIAILAFGTMVSSATPVASRLDATLVNMRFVKPLDERLILQAADTYDLIVTIEENVLAGGAGSAVNEVLAENGRLGMTPFIATKPEKAMAVLNIALPDMHLDHGTQPEQLTACEMDTAGIERRIRARLAEIRDVADEMQNTSIDKHVKLVKS